MSQKTLSAPAVRADTISRAGQRRGTVPPTISVKTVSALCAHQPQPAGAGGAGVPPQAQLPGAAARPCSLCPDAGLIVKTPGNATHNTVCQCRAGMHCSDTSCQTCVENQPCQRGFGFVAGESLQLLPLSRTDALAASTSGPPGKGGLPQQGALSRALGELCLPLCPGSIAMGRAAHLTLTARIDLPATSASLQPRPWPGCHPPASPVQKALSPMSLLKPSRAILGQGIV